MKDGLWHKCSLPIWPTRDINGQWSFFASGDCFRRWTGTQWEYKFLPETAEQWFDRQW